MSLTEKCHNFPTERLVETLVLFPHLIQPEKRSYFSVPNRIETRTPISTNLSQLVFLAETFVEIADMSWGLFEALKIIQPLQ